ncbi:MAG: hypothetical protein JNJ78_00715 [Anaerolineae bacterium]|nr:hypothetical protein [Anaerolineae bacterium]
MSGLQRWQINHNEPYCLTLAADARLGSTDYYDDQIWEVGPGEGDAAALTLRTRYGGRAGFVSLVPMWVFDGRAIYQANAYTKAPILTRFAPGYLQFEATLAAHLGLRAEYRALESHAVGINFTIANAGQEAVQVQLEVIGFVGLDGNEQKLLVIPHDDGQHALSFGNIGDIQPAVVLSHGSAIHTPPSRPKLVATFAVPAGSKTELKLVHAGTSQVTRSIQLAKQWLSADWKEAVQRIEATSSTIPQIETGDKATDLTLAFAYRELIQGFLKPTSHLPHTSVVATRTIEQGHNIHARGWSGQAATLTYLAGLAVAPIDGQVAQGLVRNFIAVQETDGWIDSKPGLNGQKQGELCPPLLARLAWSIFQYTEDDAFLKDVFKPLLKFFQRWLTHDQDGDGLPEWQTEAQTGYTFTPTFATWQAWSVGVDIRLIESPDLLAYLLSEAVSLKAMAYYLRETDREQEIDHVINKLQSGLQTLWSDSEGRYFYRDRDNHLTPQGRTLIEDGRGQESFILAEKLDPPNRLIIRVAGGVNLLPKFRIKLSGFDHSGQAVSEDFGSEGFVWAGGRGVFTSQRVYSQIDTVHFDGLSRVYRVDIRTAELTKLDIHTLIPIWSTALPKNIADQLVKVITDPERFWRANGVSMNPADDANYDSANASGSGGVWPYWLTLIGEGLIETGHMQQAAELVKRILSAQTQILGQQKHFNEFYDSDAVSGLGETGHLAGIVPLHLFMRVIGVRIISKRKVWVGGEYCWGKPITIRQHGVSVIRADNQTQITFPSGFQTTVSGNDWQEIIDTHD